MEWLVLIMFAVAVISIVAVLGDAFKRWLRLKEKQLEHAAVMAADKAAAQAAHIDTLEQRVRVLERIATDGGAKLAAEIEQLKIDRVN